MQLSWTPWSFNIFRPSSSPSYLSSAPLLLLNRSSWTQHTIYSYQRSTHSLLSQTFWPLTNQSRSSTPMPENSNSARCSMTILSNQPFSCPPTKQSWHSRGNRESAFDACFAPRCVLIALYLSVIKAKDQMRFLMTFISQRKSTRRNPGGMSNVGSPHTSSQ